jgi:pyruvate/2-oxoglutarate dehydrogenase complex dihydrolipoamide dehydrogenase (E3) component/uncharacterized membrane protein YdjX (TVP38/TMEM64 family)
MDKKRLLVLIIVLAGIAAYFVFDLGQYVSPAFFQAQRARIDAFHAAHPLQAALLYFAVYVAVTALSLPGAAAMTLVGGAIFGFWLGTALVSFASSLGATLAFLASRLVLRDWVQRHFGERMATINAGIEKEGAFYLFALRLVPLFPFFVINLLMGLTRIGTFRFYWVSQLGMLLGTMVYVYAGAQIGQFRLSAGLVVAFTLIGLLPLIGKRLRDALKARRIYARWRRPQACEFNMVVIGAGSAGLVSAYIAAATRAKVALVEQQRMGGDCLNTGCVPSKALIRSAKLLSHVARAREFGIAEASARVDFAQVMERVARVIHTVEPHDSVERYRALGVDCFAGHARITTPWTVEVQTVNGPRTLTTKSIVIAAGARPFVPPIPGLERAGYLTSDTLWNLRILPERLVVLGGGSIGCELAQAFARLGSRVTLVEMAPRLIVREDPDASEHVQRRFRAEGIAILLGHTAVRVEIEGDAKRLVAECAGAEVTVEFDQLLVAAGRVANTAGYGLEELGIATTAQRTVETDDTLQTVYPNIYACGDVAGPFQFTHTAAHQAWYAAVNALFGVFRTFRADYRVIPRSTFTDPEVARVGLNETEARSRNAPFTVTTYGIDDLDRAIADGEAHGFVKVLTAPGSDRILGVTIVGEHAGDLIAEYVLAMKHNLGLNKILGTIHIYPTMAEANKYAAGAWKRSTVTRGQWTVLEALQAWRRGAGGLGAVLRALIAMRSDRRPAYGESGLPTNVPAGR